MEFYYHTRDILINNAQNATSKVTLKLSETGDLQVTDGQNKLVEQILRTLVNDDSLLKGEINQKSSKGKILSIVTTMLKNFKNNQLNFVNGQNVNLTGYILYRKAAGTSDDFVQVSNNIIEWTIQDTSVLNNVKYTYGLTKKYDNGSESSFVDIIDITPSNSAHNDLIIGNGGIFIAGNKSVTVYVDYLVYFKNSELLNEIVAIDVTQDKADPRQFHVLVTVKTVAGNSFTLSAQRLNASTLEAI